MKFLIVGFLLFAISCVHKKDSAPDSHREVKLSKEVAAIFRLPAADDGPSIEEQWKKRDPKKPNVCMITVNSKDEGEVFRKKMGSEFNFFELAAGEDSKFMEKACDARITCDALLISGHFGGSFFGSTKFRLGLSELEQLSCESRCNGILKQPKEVYLFGCNTLASKKLDSRTPEEYANVLIEHYGFSRAQAEEVAAFRYSPIGSENADRMRRVFSNSRLYGFYAIGPSGKNVRGMLEKYLATIPNYKSYLGRFNPLEGPSNESIKAALKVTAFTEARGTGKTGENPVCSLGDKNKPLTEKLSWIENVMEDKNRRLQYIPNINYWLADLESKFGENLPDTERSFLDRISVNHTAKNETLKYTEKKIPGLLTNQIEVLNLARRLGWILDKDYHLRVKNLLSLSSTTVDPSLADIVCSSGVRADLSMSELPRPPWNSAVYRLIECLEIQSPEVHRYVMENVFTDSDNHYYAAFLLTKLNVSKELTHDYYHRFSRENRKNVLLMGILPLAKWAEKDNFLLNGFVRLLDHPNYTVWRGAVGRLVYLKPEGDEAPLKLLDLLNNFPSESNEIGRALKNLGSKSSVFRDRARNLLNHQSEQARHEILNVLAYLYPQDQETIGFLHHNDPKWVRAVIIGIGESEINDVEIHKILAEILQKNPHEEIRMASASALFRMSVTDTSVIHVLSLALRDRSEKVAYYAMDTLVYINRKMPIKDARVLSAMSTYRKSTNYANALE
ncbi:MAG: HEAT repeat domain-containing protein [Pseudobdellovibrionaceae bacterium]